MKNDTLNFPDAWPLPSEYLVELGRMSALWAHLEALLNLCLGKLAGFNDLHDPTAFIIFIHSTFPQRLQALGALCEHLKEFPNLKAYSEVIKKLEKAQKLRNKFAHTSMIVDEETGLVELLRGSARNKLKVEIESVSVDDLKGVSVAIHEAHLALSNLVLGTDVEPIWAKK